MNITLVAHDVGGVGGMERQLGELALGLRARGHAVTVIARTCLLAPGAGVIFHRVPGPRRPFVLAYPWFMLAGSLALRRRRRGVVQATGAIVVGKMDAIAVHYLHQVGGATPSRSTLLFRWHVKAAAALKRAAERRCYGTSRRATFVCVSEGLAAELREHFPAVGGRVVTIHNGINTDGFAPGAHRAAARALRARLGLPAVRLGLSPGRPQPSPERPGLSSGRLSPPSEHPQPLPGRLVAAFVGSEWERKGLHQAIRALALAPEWDLVVAGAGDRRRYQELADSLGVGEAVHWLGVTREVGAVYELADAFVLPSGYETFSLVTFEAAASGLPIVATAVNGVRELIHDGENGFLVESQPDAIAARLRQLAADPQLRARLGGAARRSALAFGAAEMVSKYEALYRRLSFS